MCEPSVHVSEPMAHSPSAASSWVNFTVNVCSAPGASLNRLGVTTAVMPGTLIVAR